MFTVCGSVGLDESPVLSTNLELHRSMGLPVSKDVRVSSPSTVNSASAAPSCLLLLMTFGILVSGSSFVPILDDVVLMVMAVCL